MNRAPAADLELNATAASILGFLDQEPKTGGELAEQIEDIIGDFWNVTRSQIYRELKVLAEHGLVATLKTGPRDSQPYRLTEAGRRAFRRWIAQRPGRPNMRVPLVLHVFFGESVPPEEMARSLADLRAYHEERLAVYRGFEERVERGSWPGEALRLGILFQETMIGWIDSLQKARRGKRPARPARKR
ncbi:MAG TPA: PadR family transcriptional regulator [Polyangiaceae bacterium]|nr:PadR family transcriptional regulator [Polyangiaceae bacterium]